MFGGRIWNRLNVAVINPLLLYGMQISADTINGKGCGQFDQRQKASPGNNMDRSSQPWMVYVLARFDPRQHQTQGTFECAGSIISPRFVLTSAHCLTNGKCTPNLVEVYYNTTVVERGPYVAAKHVFYHPGNDSLYWSSDIALLRLEEPLRFDQYVKPVCLGKKGAVRTHDEVAVPEWGLRENQDSIKMLYYSTAKVVQFSQCKRNLAPPNVKTIKWRRIVLCTQSAGRNAMEGLSGGPITLISQDKPAVQVGVGSHIFCKRDYRPSAHTLVAPYIPWIKKVLNRCAMWERLSNSHDNPGKDNDEHQESNETGIM